MEFNRKNMKYLLILISFTLVLAWVLLNITLVGSLLSGLFGLLSPFILGLCIAFVLNLILCPLERVWTNLWQKKKKKRRIAEKLKRPVCIVISVLLFLGAISAIFFVLMPQLQTTFVSIYAMLPRAMRNLESWWTEIVDFLDNYNVVLPVLEPDTEKILKTVSAFFSQNSDYLFNTTMGITMSIASVLMNVVLAIVFSIYVLAQKEKLGQNTKELLYVVLKEKRASQVLRLASLTDNTFSKFVSGQVTEALILGTLCFIGMSILRLPYALVISVVISFTALIPVFGAWVGAIIGAFLIVVDEPIKALWFLIFLVLLQQLETNLIYPKVVGSSVGLPGLWVLVAVTVGGSAFGVMGMLFAVPVFSVIYTLVGELVRTKSAQKRIPPDNSPTENKNNGSNVLSGSSK